ncbi:hypothetical protein F383_11559 [Gossypium arboreum]|uniref:Uncharacterized protein n=1 Tax=Gossypium arboreum TaxID=29729 RepID=A0A0B0N6D3_GOSAR|nr:hypothetical protein F383_11559 [Gossypium arboreum]
MHLSVEAAAPMIIPKIAKT